MGEAWVSQSYQTGTYQYVQRSKPSSKQQQCACFSQGPKPSREPAVDCCMSEIPAPRVLPKRTFPRYFPVAGPREASAINSGIFILIILLDHTAQFLCELRLSHQKRRPPIVKGGRPPKKRHMRSPPPLALHLKYAPKSTPDSNSRPSCGIARPPSFEAYPANTVLPRHLLTVGPSDASALNPGTFSFLSLIFAVFALAICRSSLLTRVTRAADPQ